MPEFIPGSLSVSALHKATHLQDRNFQQSYEAKQGFNQISAFRETQQHPFNKFTS